MATKEPKSVLAASFRCTGRQRTHLEQLPKVLVVLRLEVGKALQLRRHVKRLAAVLLRDLGNARGKTSRACMAKPCKTIVRQQMPGNDTQPKAALHQVVRRSRVGT
jgi:hypothetical protein